VKGRKSLVGNPRGDHDLHVLGELTPEQIEVVLRGAVIGRLGCHVDGRTYVVPITFAYDGECVYGHSALGLKVQMMRTNPDVCFEVEQVDDMANWRSVIAWGTYEELRGSDAATGMQTLVGRLLPLMTSATSQPTHGLAPTGTDETATAAHRSDTAGHEAIIYRIRLHERTGRFERR
jgi:nitroimidazol reductase NimA-like FMN-containing flavoprotein (pyridoxamine 5'-phosphate oxidase superfamily)